MVIRGRLGPVRHAYADLILLDRSGDKLAPFEPRVVAPCRRPGHPERARQARQAVRPSA
jgi:hypothetical protein